MFERASLNNLINILNWLDFGTKTIGAYKTKSIFKPTLTFLLDPHIKSIEILKTITNISDLLYNTFYNIRL